MPPVAIAAGIGAVGAIGGAAIQSSAAKKAAKTQQQVANQEAQRLQQNQQYVTGLNQPIIDQGNSARGLIGSFLGTEGGDRAASALATYRGSTGYQDLLNTGLGAVNANAYAKGLGASGATLKALQAKGMALADQNSGNWLNGLGNLASAGQNAIGQVAGAATNTTNNITQLQTGAADAQSNAQLAGGAQWSRALQNLANLGGTVAGGGGAGLSSSYTPIARTGISDPFANTAAKPVGYGPINLPNFGGFR